MRVVPVAIRFGYEPLKRNVILEDRIKAAEKLPTEAEQIHKKKLAVLEWVENKISEAIQNERSHGYSYGPTDDLVKWYFDVLERLSPRPRIATGDNLKAISTLIQYVNGQGNNQTPEADETQAE